MPRMNFAGLHERAKTLVPKKRYMTPFDKEIVAGNIYIAACPQNEMRFGHSVRLAMDLSTQAKVLYINVTKNEDDVCEIAPEYPDNRENFETFYLKAPDLALRFDEVQTAAVEAGAEIIVIGSFEYAATSARHRTELASHILQLSKMGIAVVVFTALPYPRLKRLADTRTGPLGLLSSETKEVWNMGDAESDTVERPGYLETMKEHEQQLRENPPPPRDHSDHQRYEKFSGMPIEQALPESDWENPLYTQYPHMCEIIEELKFKKEHGLLRLDVTKNGEYMREREVFNEAFKVKYAKWQAARYSEPSVCSDV